MATRQQKRDRNPTTVNIWSAWDYVPDTASKYTSSPHAMFLLCTEPPCCAKALDHSLNIRAPNAHEWFRHSLMVYVMSERCESPRNVESTGCESRRPVLKV